MNLTHINTILFALLYVEDAPRTGSYRDDDDEEEEEEEEKKEGKEEEKK